MRSLAALMLLGVSGVVLAQGAQPGSSSSQPRQQGAQPGSPPAGAQQSQRSQGREQSQVPSFDAVDTNRDGQLSRTEANEIDGFDFSKADVNNNASIDRQEYMAAMSDTQRPRAGSDSEAGSRSGAGAGSDRSGAGDSSSTPRQTR